MARRIPPRLVQRLAGLGGVVGGAGRIAVVAGPAGTVLAARRKHARDSSWSPRRRRRGGDDAVLAYGCAAAACR